MHREQKQFFIRNKNLYTNQQACSIWPNFVTLASVVPNFVFDILKEKPDGGTSLVTNAACNTWLQDTSTAYRVR